MYRRYTTFLDEYANGAYEPSNLMRAGPVFVTTVRTAKSYECMEGQLVETLAYADLKADIYSTDLPGEFKVIYRDSAGNSLEEIPLTGISTYKQREPEILERLHQLHEGAKARKAPDRGDPGEY